MSLENTHNRTGGRVYPLEKIRETHNLAKRYGLAMHRDGARLMNAGAAMGIPPDMANGRDQKPRLSPIIPR